jgi:cysteine desulfuration protein SufE
MSDAIEKEQQEVVEDFALFDDWESKYEYLIDMGKDLAPIDEQYRKDENLVRGCQSQVWLHADLDEEGKVRYQADSDAIITKGIIALLVRVLSGHEPQAIAHSELHFIDEIGLREHLSPTRSNGLNNMVKQMKAYALAFEAES